jgi:predicted nucleic acid-binding protein
VTLEEIQEYALVLARKKRLPQDILLLAVESLPITVVERETYARFLPEARRRISRRDPDDVDVLALTLHLQIPLWSNDHDFRNCHVELLTTETLLRRLGIIA